MTSSLTVIALLTLSGCTALPIKTMSTSPRVHFIYTAACDEYQLIQSIALDHSWREVGNKGKITRIVTGCSKPEEEELLKKGPLKDDPDFAVFFAQGDLAVIPGTGIRYPARARPVAIAQWLAATNPKEPITALLDPDMMNMMPLSEHPKLDQIRPGLMVAQRYGHGDTWYAKTFSFIGEEAPYVSEKDKWETYATGPPWLLSTWDLKRMIPHWTYYTDSSDPEVGLMREQNAFNMASLKLNIPSTGETDLMVSDSDAGGEAWDNQHAEPWKPYVLHWDGSYRYKNWEFHKALPSNGWYGQRFENKLPTVISCGAPLLEDPPTPPTKEEEPDAKLRREAWMLGSLLPKLKQAFMAYRGKECGKEETEKLGLMRIMQPNCEGGSRTRYLVESRTNSWTEHTPLGGFSCSALAQGTPTSLLQVGDDQLKVAYAVFVSDLKDATMRDVLAVQAHGMKQAVAKSRHNVELLAIVPERLPEDDENFLKKVGFTNVIRKPLPVDPSEIKGKDVKEAFEKVQGDGDENNKFLMAEETLKYWGLSLTQYDRVLMLDADVMVLDPMDELMERREDFVGTYDHGLDVSGSTVPPVQGGFLLYRPSAKDFDELLRLTREGDWDIGGTGWKKSGIGYAYGGTGPDGLLAYLYHRGGLTKLREVGKKQIQDGPFGEPVKGVRFFAADRAKYDVILNDRLRKDLRKTDEKEIIDGVKSVHFTGDCAKPWQCLETAKNMFLHRGAGNLCDAMVTRWFEMRASLEKEQGAPVSHKGCVNGMYKQMKLEQPKD